MKNETERCQHVKLVQYYWKHADVDRLCPKKFPGHCEKRQWKSYSILTRSKHWLLNLMELMIDYARVWTHTSGERNWNETFKIKKMLVSDTHKILTVFKIILKIAGRWLNSIQIMTWAGHSPLWHSFKIPMQGGFKLIQSLYERGIWQRIVVTMRLDYVLEKSRHGSMFNSWYDWKNLRVDNLKRKRKRNVHVHFNGKIVRGVESVHSRVTYLQLSPQAHES